MDTTIHIMQELGASLILKWTTCKALGILSQDFPAPHKCSLADHVAPRETSVLGSMDFAREDFARETFAREDFAREDIAHKDFERENFSKSYKMKVCRTYRPTVDLKIKCRVLFHFPFRKILKPAEVTKTNNYEVYSLT